MDGSSQFNRMGISRAWTKSADAQVRRLLKTRQYGQVIPSLISIVDAAELDLGFAPPLDPLMWSIHGHTRKQPQSPDLDDLRFACEAYQKIRHFSYQTLESDELFRTLLAERMATAGTVCGLIWMDWLTDRGCPIWAARNWIEDKRREFGLGPMFSARFMEKPEPVHNVVMDKIRA